MRNDLLQDAGDMLKRANGELAAGNDAESVRLLREATASIARFNSNVGLERAVKGRIAKMIRDDLNRALKQQRGSTVTLTKATVMALLEAAS